DPADFSGEAFLRLPLEKRIQFCTKAAELAHSRANAAPESHKISYLEIAKEWLLLAEAILKDRQEKEERGVLLYDNQSAKTAPSPQPARSSSARAGRKSKHACANSIRPSRTSIASSASFRRCR